MLWKSLFLLSFILSAISLVSAQETESAVSSNLTNISLPANAQRLLPQSIPAEITQTLDKFVAAGEGKFEQTGSEVLVWTGKEYEKVGQNTTINRLMDTMKGAGWKYEVGGVENGVTLFTLLKDGKQRRAIMGFYGESDGVLVLAWTEVLPKGGNTQTADLPVEDKPVQNNSNGSIVGTWDNGRVSTVNRQNTVTGAITPGSGTRFEYTFRANGTYGFTGLAQTQNYSCLDTLYNEVAGKYTLNGNQLTLTQTKNFWRKTSTCGANSERDYTLTKQTYQFSTKTNEYGQELICLNNESGEACYRRKQ